MVTSGSSSCAKINAHTTLRCRIFVYTFRTFRWNLLLFSCLRLLVDWSGGGNLFVWCKRIRVQTPWTLNIHLYFKRKRLLLGCSLFIQWIFFWKCLMCFLVILWRLLQTNTFSRNNLVGFCEIDLSEMINQVIYTWLIKSHQNH